MRSLKYMVLAVALPFAGYGAWHFAAEHNACVRYGSADIFPNTPPGYDSGYYGSDLGYGDTGHGKINNGLNL